MQVHCKLVQWCNDVSAMCVMSHVCIFIHNVYTCILYIRVRVKSLYNFIIYV